MDLLNISVFDCDIWFVVLVSLANLHPLQCPYLEIAIAKRSSDSYENVDIKFSVNDAFLE